MRTSIFDKWAKWKDTKVFKYTMDFKTPPANISRCDRKDGVNSLYFNAYDSSPIDPAQTRKEIYKALKELFNVKTGICVVEQSKSHKQGLHFCNVQFYWVSEDCPSEDLMLKVPKIIQENLIPLEVCPK